MALTSSLPYFFSLFFFFFFILFIREPYKIKLELLLNFIIFIVFFSLYSITFVQFYHNIIEYKTFPSIHLIYFFLICNTFISIYLNFIQTFNFCCCCQRKKNTKNYPAGYLEIDKQKYLYEITNEEKNHKFYNEAYLKSVLENPISNNYFYEFCKTEWSTENIILWAKLKEYKTIDTEGKLKMNLYIVENFIDNGSPFEVNISAEKKLFIINNKEALKSETNIYIFDDILLEIEKNLLDTWTRFVDSNLFIKMQKDLLKNQIEIKAGVI